MDALQKPALKARFILSLPKRKANVRLFGHWPSSAAIFAGEITLAFFSSSLSKTTSAPRTAPRCRLFRRGLPNGRLGRHRKSADHHAFAVQVMSEAAHTGDGERH